MRYCICHVYTEMVHSNTDLLLHPYFMTPMIDWLTSSFFLTKNSHYLLTDWLFYWLIDWLIDWLINWLADWWLVGSSIQLIDNFIDWLIDWLMDQLIDQLTDWLINKVIDWWLVGSSATGRSGQFFEEDEDDDRGGDDVQHQLQLPSTCETEQERLIKTGQMTPFGSTVLPSTTHAGPGSQTTSHIKDAVLSTSKLSPSPTNSTFSSKDQTKLAESDGDEEYVPDDTELRDSWYEEDTARHVRGKAEVGKVGFKRKLKAELNVRYEEEDGNTAISRMRIKRPRDVLVKKAADDGNEGQYRQRIR